MKKIGIIGGDNIGRTVNYVLDIETQGIDYNPTIIVVDDEPKEQPHSTTFNRREPLVITIHSIDRYEDSYFPTKRKEHERDYKYHR